MSTAAIFANPIAGRGTADATAAAAGEILRQAGWSTWRGSSYFADHETPLPEELDAAVVIGGDGTLRHVVGELILRLGERVPPILAVQTGTANLMSRHLGLTPRVPGAVGVRHAKIVTQQLGLTPVEAFDLSRLPALLTSGRRRRIDVATANGEPFLLMASAGFDARVVRLVSEARSGPILKTSYVMPMWNAFGEFSPPRVRVIADGATVFDDGPAMVMVANVAEYGAGVPIVAGATSDDGVLDLVILPMRSRFDLLRWAIRVGVGTVWERLRPLVRQVRSCVIESTRPLETQIDGDAAGFTPIVIEMTGKSVEFVTGE